MNVEEQENTMAVSARMVTQRAADILLLQDTTANQTTPSDSSIVNLISNLVFAESKSFRTSTIILATFNVLAALVTAGGILYDCYWASKRCNPKFKASKFCVSSIHPAETFPLVQAIAIIVQGVIFAVVQGAGLSSLFVQQDTCGSVARFMWAALFIVPFIQLVFGVECALRSFRSTAFQARGKWDVTICLVTVLVMLTGVSAPSYNIPKPESCYASMIWFIASMKYPAFILLAVTGGLMIAAAITIFTRLFTVNLIDQHQRIAASRMVYYLILGIISLALVIPFFLSLIFDDGDLKLSIMATVVMNLSGLISGVLHLFLRANTATTSFAPKTVAKRWEHSKHNIRIFGPNELAIYAHLLNPITGPENREPERRASHRDSSAQLLVPEKERVSSIDYVRTPPYWSSKHPEPEISDLPVVPQPTKASGVWPVFTLRQPSYSLFPTRNGSLSKDVQRNDSIYDISSLAPPPASGYKGDSWHRDSYDSATVQIGLRLSHHPMNLQDVPDTPLLPSKSSQGMTLKAPGFQQPSFPSSAPGPAQFATMHYDSKHSLRSPARPVTPLTLQTNFASSCAADVSPVGKEDLASADPNYNVSPMSTPDSSTRMLLPAQRAVLPQIEKLRESNTQLSPAVYSPSSTVYSLSPTVYSPGKQLKSPGSPRPGPPGSPGASSKASPRQRSRKDWV